MYITQYTHIWLVSAEWHVPSTCHIFCILCRILYGKRYDCVYPRGLLLYKFSYGTWYFLLFFWEFTFLNCHKHREIRHKYTQVYNICAGITLLQDFFHSKTNRKKGMNERKKCFDANAFADYPGTLSYFFLYFLLCFIVLCCCCLEWHT